jgi:hypothetical protein
MFCFAFLHDKDEDEVEVEAMENMKTQKMTILVRKIVMMKVKMKTEEERGKE